MKSSLFFNSGFGPFASIGSLKNSISCIAFAFILLTGQSVRSDITIYSVTKPNYYLDINANEYSGNSFYTTTSNTKIKTISLYLTAGGTTTGTATVNIYNTTGSPGNYTTTGSSLASSSYNVNTTLNKNLTAFDFTGANALSLTANTHYAFMLTFTGTGSIQSY